MTKFFLGIALALAAFLRFHSLGHEGFWIDEAFTLEICRSPIRSVMHLVVQGLLPPGYFTVLHYWIGLLGASEASLRGFSAVFGVLSVAAMYWLGRLVTARRSVALLSAFLLAVSPFHIHYSQEARMYSMFVFLALCSSCALFLLLREPLKRRNAFLYLVSSSLMVYTHFHGIFLLIAHAVFVISRQGTGKEGGITLKRWFSLQAVLALSLIPLLYILFGPHSGPVRSEYWLVKPDLYELYSTLVVFSGSRRLLVVFLLLLVFSFWQAWRFAFGGGAQENEACAGNGYFTWSLFLVPLLLPWIVSWAAAPIYLDRYVIVSSLGMYMLAATAMTRLPRPYLAGFALALAILFSAQQLQAGVHQPRKDNWRDAVAYVEAHAQPQDVLLFYWWYTQPAFDAYAKRQDLRKYQVREPGGEFMGSLPQGVGDAKRVWLIVRGEYNGHERTLQEKYRRSVMEKYHGVTVLLYER